MRPIKSLALKNMVELFDKYGRPPIGARVYVYKHHSLGVVSSHSTQQLTVVALDQEGGNHRLKSNEMKVIGPPELLGHCAVDTCPICEEPIRIRKHEQ